MIAKVDNHILRASATGMLNTDYLTKKLSSLNGRTINYAAGKLYCAGGSSGNNSKITILNATDGSVSETINVTSYVAMPDLAKGYLYVGVDGNTPTQVLNLAYPHSLISSDTQALVSRVRSIILDVASDRVIWVGWDGLCKTTDRSPGAYIASFDLRGHGVTQFAGGYIDFAAREIYYWGASTAANTAAGIVIDYDTLVYKRTISLTNFPNGIGYAAPSPSDETKIIMQLWGGTLYTKKRSDFSNISRRGSTPNANTFTVDDTAAIYTISDTNGIYKII